MSTEDAQVKVKDVVRLLKRLGFVPGSRTRGSVSYANPKIGKSTSVPSKQAMDMPPSWLMFLLRDIGLSFERFHELRKSA